MTPWSKTELRRTAAMIPAGRPMASANRMAHTDSSIVAGNRVRNSDVTGSRVTIELPEIAVQHVPDIDAVLHEDRLIEAVFLAQLRVPDRIDAALAGHRLDRIAGDEADEKEGEKGDPDEGRDHQADAGQDKAEHPTTISPPLSLQHKGCSFGTHPLCSGYRQRRGGRWT